MAKPAFWTSNICCIVTGASRGFGREISLSLARRFLSINRLSDGSVDLNKKISFIFISRDSGLLDELQKTVNSLSPNVHCCEAIKGSLTESSTLKSFENALQTYCEIGPQYDHSLLIHNAGSLGDPNRLVADYSTDDRQMLADYAELNLLSFIKMTGIFLKAFTSSGQKTLVNVTSLLAIQPYKGLALYGSGEFRNFDSFRVRLPFDQGGYSQPGIINNQESSTALSFFSL